MHAIKFCVCFSCASFKSNENNTKFVVNIIKKIIKYIIKKKHALFLNVSTVGNCYTHLERIYNRANIETFFYEPK